jgi:peptidoglycan/xylan/chitin deacetylase (PgdA/CDA1 family)
MVGKSNLMLIILVLLLAITLLIPKQILVADSLTSNNPSKCVCMCVAFRLDDIQDFFLRTAQKEIINMFENSNVSLTLGIIGNSFGDDTDLVNTVKESIRNNDLLYSHGPQIEIATHGWNHEDFTKFSEKEQSNLIRKANEKIADVLSIAKPTGFIPPYNLYNNKTISALRNNNMTYISASALTSTQPTFAEKYDKNNLDDINKDKQNTAASSRLQAHNNKDKQNTAASSRLQAHNNLIYNFPYTADTGDISLDKSHWVGKSFQQTLTDVKNSLSKYGFAVILMHPQEYTVREGMKFEKDKLNLKQLDQLKLLLQYFRSEGISVVNLKDVARC